MSLFRWFSKKKATPVDTQDVSSSGFGTVDATVPYHPPAKGRPTNVASAGAPTNRKSERVENRELLYAVVRESMTRVGILSSSYKFKVLSLDSRGSQYLIMMDLARLLAGETERLSEIEALIAQSAKSRHDILVTSLYWRVSEQVTVGLTPKPNSNYGGGLGNSPMPSPTKPQYEPLHDEEVAAFKRALSAQVKPLSSPGEIVQSGRQPPKLMPSFADTEIGEPPPGLSGTQYGELN